MIFVVDGKQIAFGMQWKSKLTEGDIHRDARAAKSPFFWHAEKAHYFGLLKGEDPKRDLAEIEKVEPNLEPEIDAKQKKKFRRSSIAKKKLKAPIYAGAVALVQRYPDEPNLAIVLTIPSGSPELPAGGYIVCCIQQSRPRNNFDVIVNTQLEVSEVLTAFKTLCSPKSFVLYGDARIEGIVPATMADVLQGAEQFALLRKTKSAMVNPLAFAAVGCVVIGAAIYAYTAYSEFKKAEAQRIAAAAQKNSQQLYDEEIALRRRESVLLARDVQSAISSVGAMDFSIAGWFLEKSTCNLLPDKQMVCTHEYKLRQDSKGTYETFVAAAGKLQNLEFAGDIIKGTVIVKELPFVEQGMVMDAGKKERDAIIEFTSNLQRIRHLGDPKLQQYEPFSIPPGAIASELTSPPMLSAPFEFSGPVRSIKHFVSFPKYAAVSKLVFTFGAQPMYEVKQSLAMVSVHGKIFSKNN